MIDQVPSELYQTIIARHEEAKGQIIFGYPPPTGEIRSGRVRR